MLKQVILIVDDHAVVRQGYGALLKMMITNCEVYEASGAASMYDVLRARTVDAVILDINLDDGSGLLLAPRILRTYPKIKIIFFSMFEEATIVQRAFDAGARGYISKRAQPEVMIEAIESVLKGRKFVEPRLRDSLQQSSRSAESKLSHLAPREFEIFLAVARGKSRQAIAEDLSISVKTVSNSLSLIKAKLEISSQSELVRLALEENLIPSVN